MRIAWDNPEDRFYSEGINHGVLYPGSSPGIPWNGLISVTNSPAHKTEARYLDGRKYHEQNVPGSFSGTISAYTYPDELEPFIGIDGVRTGQSRESFGISYRTNNELHILYNVFAEPSSNAYSSIGSSPDPVEFQWDFTTKPEKIPGGKDASHLVVRLDHAHPGALSDLEDLIYGNDVDEPSLPLPVEVFRCFDSYVDFVVTDNGDGTWTASGPDSAISISGEGVFRINWPTVIFVNSTTFQISS